MDVVLLDSSTGDEARQFLSSTLINESLAIDAGSLGLVTPLDIQRNVKHVFISHSHLDHIASLPVFLDNVFSADVDCPTVYAGEHSLRVLREHFFNDQIWPDLMAMSTAKSPFLRFQALRPGIPVVVEQLRVTPVELDHVVPTLGFVVEEPGAAVGFVSDTGPTDAVWTELNQTDNLRAVFVETSFPSELAWLADESKHLTPTLLARELEKLARPTRAIAVHLKAAHREQVERELITLGITGLEVGVAGKCYRL